MSWGCDRRHRKIFEASRQRFRQFSIQKEKAVLNFGIEDTAAGMYERKVAAIGDGNFEFESNEGIAGHHFVNSCEQFSEAFAGFRGGEHSGMMISICFFERGNFVFAEAINLVEDVETRTIFDTEVGENFYDFNVLLRVMRIGNIRDVQNESRFLNFFQRGAEGGDQIRRQIAEKSDRV